MPSGLLRCMPRLAPAARGLTPTSRLARAEREPTHPTQTHTTHTHLTPTPRAGVFKPDFEEQDLDEATVRRLVLRGMMHYTNPTPPAKA
jgi:hypothetical protein